MNRGRYAEDFVTGAVIVHRRGRTIEQSDNLRWTTATLNTAQGHFNREWARCGSAAQFDQVVVSAAVVLAVAVGLTTDDMSQHALADVGLADWRMPHPVFPGDTLTASSEILRIGAAPGRADAELLRYRIEARNQDGRPCCQVTRDVLLKTRAGWLERDRRFLTETRPLAREPGSELSP